VGPWEGPGPEGARVLPRAVPAIALTVSVMAGTFALVGR